MLFPVEFSKAASLKVQFPKILFPDEAAKAFCIKVQLPKILFPDETAKASFPKAEISPNSSSIYTLLPNKKPPAKLKSLPFGTVK